MDRWPALLTSAGSLRQSIRQYQATESLAFSAAKKALRGKRVTRALILLLLACLAPVLPVFGQTKAPSSGGRLTQVSLAELGNIEVTSTNKRPEAVWQTSAAIHVITNEDIRRSGARSIAEVLRLAPGVEVARIDSDHWSVGIRGFGDQFSKSVLVLIDGRSVYTPLFAGVFWSVQDTLLEDIERIEVIRGPGGTVWGSNAVNGVINIITKDSKDSQGFYAHVGGGNVEQGFGGFRFGGKAGNNFHYRIYGKGFTRAPEVHSDNSPFDDWRTAQAGFRMDWSPNSKDTFSFQGDMYTGDHGQRVNISSFSPPGLRVADQNLEVSGGNLLFRWNREFSEKSGIQVNVYYDRTHILGPQVGENRNTFDIDFVHHFALPGNQRISWGAGARWTPSTVKQTIATLDFIPRKKATNIYSFFVQDEIPLVRDRLWLTAGTKLEDNVYTGLEVQPSVRLLWRPKPRFSLWTAFTRAIRVPSRIETDFKLNVFVLASPTIFVEADGNPNIKSERLLGYESGFRTLLSSKFYVDVAMFHNDYQDLINFGARTVTVDTVPPPTRFTLHMPFANGAKGTTDGVEISPDWRPTNWWELRGSYSFLTFNLKNKPGNTDTASITKFEHSSPHHQVLVQSSFTLPRGFELDQTFRYISALPARSVRGYGTADVRLGWAVSSSVELSLVGQNLFQPHHAEFAHDPGPTVEMKRGVYVKMTWRKE